jgi:hypothetical protein
LDLVTTVVRKQTHREHLPLVAVVSVPQGVEAVLGQLAVMVATA